MRNHTVTVLAIITLLFSINANFASAASKRKIDERIGEALTEFRSVVSNGDELLNRAEGVLIFPHVTKAGFGIGGEKGDGALLINGQAVQYYQTVAASIGLQLGVQVRKQMIIFLDKEALDAFRAADGWEVGVDASVALVDLDAGGALDSTVHNEPVIGFIFGAEGLMYNVTLEGSKISRISR